MPMPIPRETMQKTLREGAMRVIDLLAQQPEQALSFHEIAERLTLDERQAGSLVLSLAHRGFVDVSLVDGAFYCALSDRVLQQGAAAPEDEFASSPALKKDADTLRYIG